MRREVGVQDFLRVPLPDELAGRFSTTIIDPVTRQPFANNTIPSSRFTRLANLALSKNYWPAPNASLPQGNYIRQRDLPTDTNQLTVRHRPAARHALGHGVRPVHADGLDEHRARHRHRARRHLLRPEDEELAGVAFPADLGSTLVNQFRIGYVGARADQHGFTAPQADIDAVGLTGVFTESDRRTADVSGDRVRRHRDRSRGRRQRGQRLPGELPADVGRQQHDD